MTRLEPWELGVLGIHDYTAKSKFDAWFSFLRGPGQDVPGDVCEVGVFRGSSLLATALLLREIGSTKRVWGFDSFAGFPTLHPNDDPEQFEALHRAGRITDAHYAKVVRNRAHLGVVGRSPLPQQASSSGDFASTTRGHVERLAAHLGLDNIVLVEGPYATTMAPTEHVDARFCAALLDCDLYESHAQALPFVWERLSSGGFIFLDEYFSLKFPGARIAVDEFFEGRSDGPRRLPGLEDGFERWGVLRGG